MKGSKRSEGILPMGHSRQEQGFVQGVLLFALAVLVAIIAAFAFANNGNQSSSERENAKVTATVLMKQASDVQDAVSRYISDGQSMMYLCVTSETSATTVPAAQANSFATCNSDTGGTPVSLFALANGYITPPVPPAAAFKSNVAQASRIWRYSDFSLGGRTLSSTTGPDVFAYMQAENVDKKVCQAINRMLNKSQDYTLVPATDEEVCFLDGTTYVYRKVIANRKPVGAT
jgi:hypothetical protein